MEDFGQEGVLDRLLRYERRIEGSLYLTLNQLRRVHDQVYKASQEDTSILERWKEEDGRAKQARMFGSCPPGPRPSTEEVVRGRTTCEDGPPTRSIRSGNPETPAGVTTNAQADGQSCKTKPISSAVARSEDEMRETNSISAAAAVETALIPVFHHSSIPVLGRRLRIRRAKRTQFRREFQV